MATQDAGGGALIVNREFGVLPPHCKTLVLCVIGTALFCEGCAMTTPADLLKVNDTHLLFFDELQSLLRARGYDHAADLIEYEYELPEYVMVDGMLRYDWSSCWAWALKRPTPPPGTRDLKDIPGMRPLADVLDEAMRIEPSATTETVAAAQN